MRPPAAQSARQRRQDGLALYRALRRIGLSAIRPAGAVMTMILIGLGASGCSLSRSDALAKMEEKDVTGSVTPLSQAYASDDGRTCRDFLASYVKGRAESWLQGAACKGGHGRWEIQTIRPWKRG